MLTRLKVNGFKNLAEVDVRFGPFTCIAGANGVGKSNLFDAIFFLSALADRPLMDAAKCVRDEHRRSTDVNSLFLKVGNKHVDEMSFEAEMIVPPEGSDDLGQPAHATITFLRYTLVLQCRPHSGHPSTQQLEVKREELRHINISEARTHLAFDHNKPWRESAIRGRRTGGAFISTEGQDGSRSVKLHQDQGGGRPRALAATTLPRTVLSSADALEAPTALLARREMQSWRLLQLEPTALRQSDPFHSPVHIAANGGHLASTLYHLARSGDEEAVYAQVANRLSQLVEDIHSVHVDVDQKRELFTLQIVDRDRNIHAARALSDGTLRFLALTILELDPDARGVVCFEEPENGIHPARIHAMLHLLKDLAVNVEDVVNQDNPLRQVIVNTHSPAVVGLVDDADLLVAEPKEAIVLGKRCRTVGFSWLDGTWRQRAEPEKRPLARGSLSAYLNPLAEANGMGRPRDASRKSASGPPRTQPVKDRSDLQLLLPGVPSE